MGIKFISSISVDSTVNTNYKYYITISNTDIDGNAFGLNTFYKVQIRFGDIVLPGTVTAAWLNTNIDHFSEWSQVCLIKGIEQPYININTLGGDDPISNPPTNPEFIAPPTAFAGQLYYSVQFSSVQSLSRVQLFATP